MRGADYVIKRVAFAVVTIFVALTINFALFRLAPGSAVANLSRVPHATPETRLALKKEFGLDKSRGTQYVLYLKQLAHGNLGVSFANQQPVSANLRTAVKNTIPMVLLGTLFAIILGTFTGVIAAWRRGTAVEGVSVTTALGFYSMPTHWLGLMLVILFAGTLPTGGLTDEFLVNPSFMTHLKDLAAHITLPALTLGLVLFGEYTLIVRSAMLETLGEDYILTARAKGLGPGRSSAGTRCATRCFRSRRSSPSRSATSWRARSSSRPCSRGPASAAPSTTRCSRATTRCCRARSCS